MNRTLCLFAASMLLTATAGCGADELLSPVSAAAPHWPQWRGPNGQGHADVKNLPAEFGDGKNVTWKTPIPGKGWSSPVIEGDRIWMTTAIDKPESEADIERRLKENTGNQPLTLSDSVSLRAVCVHLKTGELLHDIEVLNVSEPQWVHTLNSYASPTPIIRDGLLYCHFGALGNACLNTKTGKVVWTETELEVMHENGPGSTPVLWRDKFIFHMDGSDEQYIVALDAKTGDVAWKTDRSGRINNNPQLKKSYGTPLIVNVDGKDVLMSPGSDWLYAYDPATGEELWKVNYGVLGFSIVPRPVVGHGLVFVNTSFMKSELLAVRYDGKGETKEPHIVWRHSRGVPKMSSSVLIGDEIYFVSDQGGIFSCLDAKTGEVRYTERLGGNHSSSPLYADGKIFLGSREGKVAVIKPGTTFEKLAENQLDGAIMATPAAADGALFIRTEKSLYRIEKK